MSNGLPPGHRKLNSDAATFKDGTVGLSFVVRDEHGMVLMAGSKRCHSAGSSTLAEALALRFGLEKTREAGLGRVQLESDSKILVKNCSGSSSGDAHVMMIVEDLKSMVNIVHGIEISHCRRDAQCSPYSRSSWNECKF
ncbi:hypothetical protein ACS0TY_011538 [Phlomoides rotata]